MPGLWPYPYAWISPALMKINRRYARFFRGCAFVLILSLVSLLVSSWSTYLVQAVTNKPLGERIVWSISAILFAIAAFQCALIVYRHHKPRSDDPSFLFAFQVFALPVILWIKYFGSISTGKLFAIAIAGFMLSVLFIEASEYIARLKPARSIGIWLKADRQS
jgi:hypothetical protein